ncbi:LPS export ABC transporter permease LptG [Halorhodospira halochloris]|uniref:Predicted Permease n=1 Tax=Halorhodospira halochloris TaxID=1052 RepID=A0A110B4S0_HALHR|nr:LPS export ABC transporter permease LptG [Halorhodospira halochloris]MBK1651557.1 LPS export ABC transporter permease LptG [Halorhodospira halochloris]MCG5530987.1 LPS export ABC transporter permease LptG [Halorhodospira halochloris]MCG5548768.1 LPS export ABC transporter permease LptG [Halorhodospira halochloris]BAU57176.1 Predicted Permease [Halorhodospira halochloris]
MLILVVYLARTVILAALVALAAILALDLVFALADGVADGDESTFDVLLAALLDAPELAYEAFPFATLIGSLMGLGALAARQELTAMRAAGVSVVQIAGAVMAGGLVLAVLASVVGEYVVPAAERQMAAMQGAAEADELRTGPGGDLWARDGRDFLRAERPRSRSHLQSVTVFRFADGELTKRIGAEEAFYDNGSWRLEQVEVISFDQQGVELEKLDSWRWPGELRPDLLALVVADPEKLPALELWRYIRYLENNDLDSAQYRLALWEKIATPLATLAMMLVTVPLVFTAVRSAGAGQRIVVGILVGAAFFLVNRALGQAGIVYGLPPSVAALLPVVVFFIIGAVGVMRVR